MGTCVCQCGMHPTPAFGDSPRPSPYRGEGRAGRREGGEGKGRGGKRMGGNRGCEGREEGGKKGGEQEEGRIVNVTGVGTRVQQCKEPAAAEEQKRQASCLLSHTYTLGSIRT